MFRDAKDEDLPAIVEMGAKLHAAAGLADFLAFDPISFETTLSVLMEDGLLLVVGDPLVGAAGIMVFPAYFNLDHTMATEVLWWLEPEHRGCGRAFLSEIETRTKAAGVTVLMMGCMEALRPEGMARMYQQAGYRPMDHFFYKGF